MKYDLLRCKKASTKGWRILYQSFKVPSRTRTVVIRPLPTSARLKWQLQSPPLIKTRSRKRQPVTKFQHTKEKELFIETVLQLRVEEPPHGIKQVSFPSEKEGEFIEARRKTPRLTTSESAAPFETSTCLHLTQRTSMVSPYKARRQSILRRLTEIGLDNKSYLDNTPKNVHHQWGYSNKLNPNKIDLSQCILKEDCPLALKAMYEFIGSKPHQEPIILSSKNLMTLMRVLILNLNFK